jgi:hypothetical protein
MVEYENEVIKMLGIKQFDRVRTSLGVKRSLRASYSCGALASNYAIIDKTR